MTGWARRYAASRTIRAHDDPAAAAWQATLRWQATRNARRAVMIVCGYHGSFSLTGYAASSVTDRSMLA